MLTTHIAGAYICPQPAPHWWNPPWYDPYPWYPPRIVYVPVPYPVSPVISIPAIPSVPGKVEIKIEISTQKPKLGKKQSRRW